MKKVLPFLIFLLFLLSACAVKQQERVSSKSSIDDLNEVVKSDTKKGLDSNAQIIFLSYKVSKNINEEIEINIINKIIKSGKLKNEIRANDNYVNGDFKFIELDANKMPIYNFHITNPLRRRVEYVNNAGELESKLLDLDSAELSVRIQLNPKTRFIAIDQVNDPGKVTRNLIITKIK